jgi:toxin ParE1/3/4
MAASGWRIRLSGVAEQDFSTILQWTAQTFGPRQAHTYRVTLLAALAALATGPNVPGSRPRDEILSGLRTLHCARRGRRGRHFILYRTASANTIEVVRILHEAMDLPRHVPESGSDSSDASQT